MPRKLATALPVTPVSPTPWKTETVSVPVAGLWEHERIVIPVVRTNFQSTTYSTPLGILCQIRETLVKRIFNVIFNRGA